MEGAVSEKDCMIGLGTCMNDQCAVCHVEQLEIRNSAVAERKQEGQDKEFRGEVLQYGEFPRLRSLAFPKSSAFFAP